jgi:hypothetical protein
MRHGVAPHLPQSASIGAIALAIAVRGFNRASRVFRHPLLSICGESLPENPQEQTEKVIKTSQEEKTPPGGGSPGGFYGFFSAPAPPLPPLKGGSAEGAPANHAAAGSAPGPAGQPGRVKTLEFPAGGDQQKIAARRAVNEVSYLPPGAKIPLHRQDKVIKTKQEENSTPGGGSAGRLHTVFTRPGCPAGPGALPAGEFRPRGFYAPPSYAILSLNPRSEP